jgi:hypothetical protein
MNRRYGTVRAPDDLPFMEPESDAPEVLFAWHGGFAYSEHYRKVVLAHCRAIERAKAVAAAEKVTENTLEDRSRLHPAYLGYLARMLAGRVKYEAARREQMGAV